MTTRKILRGSASNLLRLVLSVLVATVLPPVLVHHLSKTEYSAWVLILQLSAYINLLDLGLQTVISKMIAENDALKDDTSSQRLLSTSFGLLSIIAGFGLVLVGVMVWQVPHLFGQMPPALYFQVRLGLLLIGFSAAFGLPFNTFIAVFTGLQSYRLPTLITLVSRFLSASVLVTLVLMRQGLILMTSAVALINVATAIWQFYAWRVHTKTKASFSFFLLHRNTASRLLRSGSVIAVWSLGELFVSGLDLLFVGHFDYANTGFYAIAASATNFMLLIISSLFSPLLPAMAAMQTTSTPQALGKMTIQVSRYCILTLCVLSLPLLLIAFPLLTLWVGSAYALKTVLFLQILVVGNCLRQFCYPYSLAVIATGKQNFATLAAIGEAVVNLGLSWWLGSRMGALGIAFGTLGGAAVSVVLHLTVSMSRTRSAIDFPVSRFVTQSLLRPLTCAIPFLLLLPWWHAASMLPVPPGMLAAWFASTLLIFYLVGLTAEDHTFIGIKLQQFLQQRLKSS